MSSKQHNTGRPSPEEQSVQDTRKATQENQDRNRPDQNQAGQQGQKDVVNDSSNQHYGLTDTKTKEVPDALVENEPKERIDHL